MTEINTFNENIQLQTITGSEEECPDSRKNSPHTTAHTHIQSSMK